MKKINEFKAKRYYQGEFGLFVDVERHDGETTVRLGTTMNRVCPVISDMPIASRAACCTFCIDDERALTDTECMEAFEKIYWKFASAYIFWFISDTVSVYPYEDAEYGTNSLDMDDFSELEVTRYKQKDGKQKYYLDVEIVRTVENPKDVHTNVYIMDTQGYTKTLCDRYAYEVPKQKYKEILEKNFYGYIGTYRQEMADQEYYIPLHKKPDDGKDCYTTDTEGFMGDMELPFN